MTTRTILWRRLDVPGHDSACLREPAAERVLEGTAVFLEDGAACRLDYHVVCDLRWRTRRARVAGWLGDAAFSAEIRVDEDRRWTVDGREVPAVHGCDDLDLAFSPATNVIAIRRLGLEVGASAPVRAAWLVPPARTLEPLDQTYRRLDAHRYAYTSGDYEGVLVTDDTGFVTHYPRLWQREGA